jgi:hypothetical protein
MRRFRKSGWQVTLHDGRTFQYQTNRDGAIERALEEPGVHRYDIESITPWIE